LKFGFKKYPFNLHLLNANINVLRSVGKFEEAFNLVDKALEIDSLNLNLMVNKARLYFDLSKHKEAIKLCEACILQHKEHPIPYIELVKIYLKLGNEKEAKIYAEKFTNCNLTIYKEKTLKLTYKFFMRSNFVTEGSKVLDFIKNNYLSSNKIDLQLCELEFEKDAVKKENIFNALLQDFRLMPFNLHSTLQIANILIHENKVNELIEIKNLLANNGYHFQSNLVFAKSLRKNNEHKKAITHCKIALKHTNIIVEKLSVYKIIVNCYFALKDFSNVLRFTDLGLKLSAIDETLNFKKANVLKAKKEFDSAILYFEKAIEFGNNQIKFHAYLNLFDIYFAKKQIGKCKGCLENAIKIKGKNNATEQRASKIEQLNS